MIAAILHDTIDDTETNEQELIREFGKEVADIVMEVTGDKAKSNTVGSFLPPAFTDIPF